MCDLCGLAARLERLRIVRVHAALEAIGDAEEAADCSDEKADATVKALKLTSEAAGLLIARNLLLDSIKHGDA